MKTNKFFNIPLSKPSLKSSDWKEIKNCFDSTWISSKSPWVNRFEEKFAKVVSGTKYAVSVNSGTSALFIALKALGIGEGDEVILPSFTMVASFNAVIWAGAKPILVDSISKDNWNMDVEAIESKITPNTKAIMPVHIYGYSCDMNRLKAISKKYKLHIIEDAAEAMGSKYDGKPLGSFGIMGCFSLYSNKIITTGNGGMVVTNDKNIYDLLTKLRFFDFGDRSHFIHHRLGYNFALSGIQAALGLSQLKRFESLLKKRQIIYSWYKKLLDHSKELMFPEPVKQNIPNYWFPAVLFNSSATRKKVVLTMEKNGIESRDFFFPMHTQPVHKHLFINQYFPNSEYFYTYGLLLPSFFELSYRDVVNISNIISSSL